MVPDHITHLLIDKSVSTVRRRAFYEHPNIQEVICHACVNKIGREAFSKCPNLRRVIMRGVKVIEEYAFNECNTLSYIECGKLESIGERAFLECTSLERIILPLKNDMITVYTIFQRCNKLNHVDLVGGVHETIAALPLEEWKNDMNKEIDAINRILPRTPATGLHGCVKKAMAIRKWMRKVHRKYTHYNAEHQRYLNLKAALEPALPKDIVLKNIHPFLAKRCLY